MALTTWEMKTNVNANADAFFSFISNWDAYRNIGFPFARFRNLPDGQFVIRQEADLVAKYLIFFSVNVYIRVLDMNPQERTWETYSVQAKQPGMYNRGKIIEISPTQFQSIQKITLETQEKSLITQTKHYLDLQSKKMIKRFQNL